LMYTFSNDIRFRIYGTKKESDSIEMEDVISRTERMNVRWVQRDESCNGNLIKFRLFIYI
jgi:hypothetical protein